MTRMDSGVTKRGAVGRELNSTGSLAPEARAAVASRSHVGTTRPTAPELCHFCGEPNNLIWSTHGIPWVSEWFPAHRGCVQDWAYERAVEHMLREERP